MSRGALDTRLCWPHTSSRASITPYKLLTTCSVARAVASDELPVGVIAFSPHATQTSSCSKKPEFVDLLFLSGQKINKRPQNVCMTLLGATPNVMYDIIRCKREGSLLADGASLQKRLAPKFSKSSQFRPEGREKSKKRFVRLV